MLETQLILGQNHFLIWTATMGNAATCQACGSERALKSSGSSKDLNVDSDFYRAADCMSDIDDCPVRGWRRNGFVTFAFSCVWRTDVLEEASRANLLSTRGVPMRFNPWAFAGVWPCPVQCDRDGDCADIIHWHPPEFDWHITVLQPLMTWVKTFG